MVKVSLNAKLVTLVFSVWLLIVLFGVYLTFRYAGKSFWAGWELRDGGWCEYDRTTEFVRERSNSWSDVSYLFLGLWMISRGIFDEAARKKSNYMLPEIDKSLHQEVKYEALFVTNPLVAIPWISIIVGFYNVLHAFGTFWYHACACYHGHNLDVGGMLAVTSFPWTYVLLYLWAKKQKYFGESTIQSGAFMYGASLSLLFVMYFTFSFLHMTNLQMELLMVLVITLDLGGIVLLSREESLDLQYGYLWKSIPFLAIGFIFQRMDKEKIFCFPHHIIQGHAVWHVLTCISIYYTYMFFRTAQPRQPSTKRRDWFRED